MTEKQTVFSEALDQTPGIILGSTAIGIGREPSSRVRVAFKLAA